MPHQGPLAGRVVALAETRELDTLTSLFLAEGAAILRCPLVAILDAEPEPVLAWMDRFIAGGMSHLVLYTGEGLRRLLVLAEGNGRRDAFVAALGQVVRITRGPKPARALHEIGLAPNISAKQPTTEGLITAVRSLDLAGQTIGVQVYPGDGPNRLMDVIRSLGGQVDPVAPYIYAPKSDQDAIVNLMDRLHGGEVDVLCFTSASQVDRLWEVAEGRGLRDRLEAGLSQTKVAAVGPVVHEALVALGRPPDIEPTGPYFMKPLVRAVIEAFR